MLSAIIKGYQSELTREVDFEDKNVIDSMEEVLSKDLELADSVYMLERECGVRGPRYASYTGFEG